MKYSDDSTADHSYMCTSNDALYEKMRPEVLPRYRDKKATPIKLACVKVSYLVREGLSDFKSIRSDGVFIMSEILSISVGIVS